MKVVFVMCYFMIFLLYILFLMKNMETHLVGSSIGDNDLCLADSASTHTILKDKKFFSFLIMQGSDVNTISGSAKLIGAPEELLYCYPEEQKFILMMHYILQSLKEIY